LTLSTHLRTSRWRSSWSTSWPTIGARTLLRQ
jgi:hypothetical protein